MKTIIIQSICLLVIIGLGYFLYNIDYKKLSVKSVVSIAIFAILRSVLALLSLTIPLFGFPSLRIGIGQLPLILGGIALGPFNAFILGLVADLIGLIINPTGFPFLGFTLGNILCAVIPALIANKYKGDYRKLMIGLLAVFSFMFLSIIIVTSEIIVQNNGESVVVTLGFLTKLLLTGGLALIIASLIFNYRLLKKRAEGNDFYIVLISVVLVELIVNVIMTPIWLEIMFDIPFWTSSLIRVIKMAVMIFVETYLIYALLRFLRKSGISLPFFRKNS
ncbi:MAG: folate family ECF transporter S component [Erysipelotrichaceae bacterium]